jgi:hypothetical protein
LAVSANNTQQNTTRPEQLQHLPHIPKSMKHTLFRPGCHHRLKTGLQ